MDSLHNYYRDSAKKATQYNVPIGDIVHDAEDGKVNFLAVRTACIGFERGHAWEGSLEKFRGTLKR